MRIRLPALFAIILFGFVLALVPTVALAQEPMGAARMELSAAPGGGMLFTKPAKTTDIDFSNYALAGGFTYNINTLVGVEGEIGGGLGLRHTFTNVVSAPMLDEAGSPVLDEAGNVMAVENTIATRTRSPRTLGYEGNLVLHPRGNDHALVPYVTGGIGGLTLFTRSELKPLGLMNNETYFTGNTGAGLKWFVAPGWGLRADYRFLIIKSKKTAPEFFGLNENRYGHRIYGSLVYTFGK